MALVWQEKSCTPKLLLNYGTSESGAVKTKSVSIPDINPKALTVGTIRNAVNNVIYALGSANVFAYPLYDIQATATYKIYDD